MSCEAWPIIWPCDTPPVIIDPEAEDNPPGAVPAVVVEAAVDAAEALLWAHTGRRLGMCTVTERYAPPTSNVCGMPYKDEAGFWHNGGRGGACCSIWLYRRPVDAVVSVKVWGQVIPPDSYRLDRQGRLTRLGVCWPAGADCDEPPVEVTYRHGAPIGDVSSRLYGAVALAMGEVATEYVRAACGDPCRLPARAVSITRANVTTAYPSPKDLIDNGRLGLPLADALISLVNPSGRKHGRSRVFTPDRARRV